MYIRATTTLRWEPELHAKVVARASDKGMSVNEWIIKAVEHALASKDPSITIRTERKYIL